MLSTRIIIRKELALWVCPAPTLPQLPDPDGPVLPCRASCHRTITHRRCPRCRSWRCLYLAVFLFPSLLYRRCHCGTAWYLIHFCYPISTVHYKHLHFCIDSCRFHVFCLLANLPRIFIHLNRGSNPCLIFCFSASFLSSRICPLWLIIQTLIFYLISNFLYTPHVQISIYSCRLHAVFHSTTIPYRYLH